MSDIVKPADSTSQFLQSEGLSEAEGAADLGEPARDWPESIGGSASEVRAGGPLNGAGESGIAPDGAGESGIIGADRPQVEQTDALAPEGASHAEGASKADAPGQIEGAGAASASLRIDRERLATLAARVREGQLTAEQAGQKLVDSAVDRVAGSLPEAERSYLRAQLLDAMGSNPLLQSIMRDLHKLERRT